MREAIAAAEEQAYAHTHAYPYLYAAELHAQIKQWNDALRMANAGLHIDAALLPLQELRLRAAVATQEFEQAAEAAERISVLRPTPKTALRHAAQIRSSPNRYGSSRERSRTVPAFAGAEAGSRGA